MEEKPFFEKIIEDTVYDNLSGVWWVSARPTEYGFNIEYAKNYQKRVELFCLIIECLLSEGKIRIAKQGVFLDGTPIEQANRFREAFPKTEEEMKEKEGYWWYTEECPGGAVWYTHIDDNGFQTFPVGDGRFYFWT